MYKRQILFVTLILLISNSCGFSDFEGFKCRIDEERFETENVSVSISIEDNSLMLSATTVSNIPGTIRIGISDNFDGEGTYEFNEGSNYASFNPSQFTIVQYNSFNGSLTISDLNKERIEGTFNFSALRNTPESGEIISITRGEFNIAR